MWRFAPSPVPSERRPETGPSKIVSAFVTSSSKVGGITVVARTAWDETATRKARTRERKTFIKSFRNVRMVISRVEVVYLHEGNTGTTVHAADNRSIIPSRERRDDGRLLRIHRRNRAGENFRNLGAAAPVIVHREQTARGVA